MADLPTCQICSKLLSILKMANDGERYVQYELGRLSDVIDMPCPHSDSILKLWESLWESNGPERMKLPESSSVKISLSLSNLVEISLSWGQDFVATHIELLAKPNDTGHWGTATLLDSQWIDPAIPSFWYATCLNEHGAECQNPNWRKLQPGTMAFPEWLIDVNDQCIVPFGSKNTKYFTLSYTWGSVKCLKNTTGTLQQLREVGSLQPHLAPNIPQTVRDAMGITYYLGERYLWVDSLCIVQDDIVALSRNINVMHQIYANSNLCLVAFSGTDANHGLRGIEGISAQRCVEHITLDIAGGETLSYFTRPRVSGYFIADDGSNYCERGWTFQEFVFAKRRLIFNDGPLRWDCTQSKWSEEASGFLEDVFWTFGIPLTFWMDKRYPSLPHLLEIAASEFNNRYFTYQTDTLQAFLGIQNHLCGIFHGGLNYGHPEIFFDISLLWTPGVSGVTRRIALTDTPSDGGNLPSWSWMGYQGRFSFPRDGEYQWDSAAREGFTESVAAWFAMESALPSLTTMRPVNCQWHQVKTLFEIGAGQIPDGWVQVVTDTGSMEYQVLSDMGEDAPLFKYPVPIPAFGEATSPIQQLRFLFAKTTRCYFATRQVVAPGFHEYSHCMESCVELCPAGGAFAGFLKLHSEWDIEHFLRCKTVELVAVAKGWTTDLSDFLFASREQNELRAVQSLATSPPKGYTWPKTEDKTRHECYFVLCVQWENGVAQRQASGKVFAEVWERSQEPVDLILG